MDRPNQLHGEYVKELSSVAFCVPEFMCRYYTCSTTTFRPHSRWSRGFFLKMASMMIFGVFLQGTQCTTSDAIFRVR